MRLLINEALEWPSFLDVENEPLAYALDGDPATASNSAGFGTSAAAPHANSKPNSESSSDVSVGAVLAVPVAPANGTAASPLSTARTGEPGPVSSASLSVSSKVHRMLEFIFDRLEMRFGDTPMLVRYSLCYITLSHYGTFTSSHKYCTYVSYLYIVQFTYRLLLYL